MSLSVVIPVAPNDNGWKSLLLDLIPLEETDECILVSPENIQSKLEKFLIENPIKASVVFVQAPLGRAIQQNQAAQLAKNSWLWFLHCDSRLSGDSIFLLKKEIENQENIFYFFNLKFFPSELSLMWINEIGVKIRSNFFRIPFGDQGFCIKKETFNLLSGFNEQAKFGEDHLLVWSAHKSGIKLKAVDSYLFTSPRKYQKNGWGKVTFDHVIKTILQASPEIVELVKIKIFGSTL
jgi:hypothetical protein